MQQTHSTVSYTKLENLTYNMSDKEKQSRLRALRLTIPDGFTSQQ